jgi:3-oxoacyl-[acyl-carrier protein] reductase
MLSINLVGKTCVVTGGGGQLGRTIARTLADCGAAVAVHYLTSKQTAQAVADQITASGGRAMAVQADITQEVEVLRMRDQVTAALGDADIIVNNAVAQYGWKSVLEQALADYESQFRSCVLHNVLMAKAFVPAMIKKGWGRVIATNTECAMQNFPSQSAYVSGKRGMDGVLRVLAKEIGQHQITVNQVAPGWTISDRERKDGIGDYTKTYIKTVPLGHRGSDQDIANTVAFLASDLAGFITGAYIPVCGGNVMPTI